jgi:hypothetical protein
MALRSKAPGARAFAPSPSNTPGAGALLPIIVVHVPPGKRLFMDLSSIMAQASETLLRQGSHLPTLMIEFEGMRAPVRSSLRSFPQAAEQKPEILYRRGRRMGRRYGHVMIRHVWFVIEAWMNRPVPGTPYVVPSLDPEREEVLLVLELNALDLHQSFEGRKMIRNQAGKLIDLQPLKDFLPEGDAFEVTGILLPAFLAGFVEVAAAYQGTGRLEEILAHMLIQELRMRGLFENHS